MLEENKCLRDEIVSLRYKIHADRDRFLYLDKEIQELGGPKRLLSTSRAAWRDVPSISSFNEGQLTLTLASRSGRPRYGSPSPRRRYHADGDLVDRATPICANIGSNKAPMLARKSQKPGICISSTVREPSTPLSDRRTTSKSPACHLGISGEADGNGSLTKKEKRAAESERAAEWAQKRKEKKAS